MAFVVEINPQRLGVTFLFVIFKHQRFSVCCQLGREASGKNIHSQFNSHDDIHCGVSSKPIGSHTRFVDSRYNLGFAFVEFPDNVLKCFEAFLTCFSNTVAGKEIARHFMFQCFLQVAVDFKRVSAGGLYGNE